MFKISLSMSVLLFLSGCSSVYDDMSNNKFLSVTPSSQPREVIGNWTGTHGPYLVTMQINADGNGLWCYEYGVGRISKIKISRDTIYMQDGIRLLLSDKGESLQLSSPYLDGGQYNFERDNQLHSASLFCAKKLK